VGFVVDKVALGQVSVCALRFHLPIFIPTIAPKSPSSIILGWCNGPTVAAVPSGLSHTTNNNNNNINRKIIIK
jgi:hypothetical protein